MPKTSNSRFLWAYKKEKEEKVLKWQKKKSDSTSKRSHVIDENGQILFHEDKKVRNSLIQY